MQIPDKTQCQRIMDKMQMPIHIQDHCCLVYQVAVCLTDDLVLSGVALNRPLVVAAALLHDITKHRSFKTRENHAQTGGDYLTDLGFPEVGNIVRQHVVLDDYFVHLQPVEAEVVNYADKRVLHDRVVGLDERMAYILQRYAHTADHRLRLQQLWEQTLGLEERLFGYLAYEPRQLGSRLAGESAGEKA